MEPYTVRWATPSDEAAIDNLLYEAGRLILHTAYADVQHGLHKQRFMLVERDGQIGCLCGWYVGPETVAHVKVFALVDDWSVEKTVHALLALVKQRLHEQGVRTLAYVGLERWLLDGLSANGFCRANTILTLQKTDFDVPDAGNTHVIVRPASIGDFSAILAIDEAVFVPIWRNTKETLTKYMSTCPHFTVAVLDGAVVGYQCLATIGRHGHLTRVAIHPDYQGRRIAARLLVEAIDLLRRKRVFGITLNTQQDNHRARSLYEWFGFKVLGKEAQVLILEM